MQIYTRETIAEAAGPANPERALLTALVRNGPQPYIANVEATVLGLAAGGALMPLVRVDGPSRRPAAYVASPTTHYIDYARREIEIELAQHPLLRRLLPPLIAPLRLLMDWATVERAVYVNNWLLSTNLYPPLSPEAPAAILHGLLRAYPDHTIIYRSLGEELNAGLIAQLEGLGFQRVFSRQIYLIDPRDGAFRRKRSYLNDRRLVRRSPYRWRTAAELSPNDAVRLCELYSDLYLHKYSFYNPQFTPRLIGQALREHWLAISALECDGILDGVLGTISCAGVITTPLFGYDRARDQRQGLYRLLSFALLEAAAEQDCLLHLSSGAAAYKRHRGGMPQLEYSLVYHRHLAPRRRLPWQLLAALSQRVIIPLVRHYGL